MKVAKTVTVFKQWKHFAKDIGLPDDEIKKIEEQGGSGQVNTKLIKIVHKYALSSEYNDFQILFQMAGISNNGSSDYIRFTFILRKK